MAFKDYSTTPASNTSLGDGTYIGPNMFRNKVRPAFQQLAADGKALADEVEAIPGVAAATAVAAVAAPVALAAGYAASADADRIATELARDEAEAFSLTPGPPGTPGINGGVGSSAGYGALFNAANGMAVGAGITRVKLSGNSVAGIGGADYIYDAAVNGTTVAANPKTQFLAADGRGFKLDPEQRLTIEMAGGRGDWVSWASPGTDNTPALNALLAAMVVPYDTLAAKGPTIYFAAKNYYFSQEVAPRMQVNLYGEGSGHDDRSNMTRFYFPTDTHGIVINSGLTNSSGDTTPSQIAASGSNIVGICAISQNATVGANIRHGFILHARANLIRCTSEGFTGDGFHVVAGSTGLTVNGNANGWFMERCLNKSAGQHGFYIRGNDANAGGTLFCQSKLSGLCGLYENSGLGNQHYGFWEAGHDSKQVGKVSYLGRHYILINATAGIGQTTTPGTDDTVWSDVSAGSSYPAWDPLVVYQIALAVFSFGTSNRSGFHGGYQEGHYSHCENPQSVRDWQGLWSRYSPNEQGITTAQDARYSNTGYGGYYKPLPGSSLGTYARATIGADFLTGTFLSAEQESDPSSWRWRFVGPNLLFDHGATTATQVFEITGPLTAQAFGATTGMPYVFNAYKFALGKTIRRIISNGTAAPTTGEHARGEICFNTNSSANGIFAWVCSVTGTPGTWVEVRNYGQMVAQADTAALTSVNGTNAAAAPTQAEFNALVAEFNKLRTDVSAIRTTQNALLAKLRTSALLLP